MQTLHKKVGLAKEIKLPKIALKTLNLHEGEEVLMKLNEKEIVIKPFKNPVERLSNLFETRENKSNLKEIDELIDSEEWY